MKVKFLGATKTVTGSKYLVQNVDTILMIDCGLYQGTKEDQLLNREEFPVPPSSIDALILTHGHLDHCGFIPKLVKDGFKGPIYSTKETIEIAKIILLDSAKIQVEDAKKYTSKKNPLSSPLYTEEDALKCFDLFKVVDFESSLSIGSLEITFQRAGHILGAMSVYVKGKKTILFSGDLGRYDDPLMKSPEDIVIADIVIMESTYGNRLHDSSNPEDYLENLLERVVKEKKVLLVPSFAVARAQLFLYYLNRVFSKRPDLEVPAFVNSPMVNKVTELYKEHNEEILLSKDDFKSAMSSARFLEWSKEYSKLNKKKGPLIILAASGMVSGGRILEHLDHFGKYANNILLLIGYQSEGTIGHGLEQGENEIHLLGHKMEVKAEVKKMNNLSAHADQRELLKWLSSSKEKIEKVVLVHGEESAQLALKSKIEVDLDLEVHLSQDIQEIEC